MVKKIVYEEREKEKKESCDEIKVTARGERGEEKKGRNDEGRDR